MRTLTPALSSKAGEGELACLLSLETSRDILRLKRVLSTIDEARDFNNPREKH